MYDSNGSATDLQQMMQSNFPDEIILSTFQREIFFDSTFCMESENRCLRREWERDKTLANNNTMKKTTNFHV